TGTFMDYLVPTASEAPTIDIAHIVSPSPLTPLGSKGLGESSSMTVPAAIANAVSDALSPLGIRINDLPMTPTKLWTIMERAKSGAGQESGDRSRVASGAAQESGDRSRLASGAGQESGDRSRLASAAGQESSDRSRVASGAGQQSGYRTRLASCAGHEPSGRDRVA